MWHRRLRQWQVSSEAGISLIEVIMVTVVISILALATAELFRLNLSGQQSVAKGYQMENLHEEIRVFLSKEIDCTATFGGLDPRAVTSIPALKKAGTPPTLSRYVTGTSLADNQIDLTRMTLNGTKYSASSTPFSAEVPLEINYKKRGLDFGLSDFLRSIILEVQLDPAGTGLILSCVSKAKMTDGLWRQTLTSPPGQMNIFYAQGTVAVGSTTPNDLSGLHVHSNTTQGSFIVSGASDAGQTWAAMYLADTNATTQGSAGKSWTMAFKNQAGAAVGAPEADRFELNYSTRTAGSWVIGSSEWNAFTVMPPSAPKPWPRMSIGSPVSDPNTMLQVYNSRHQGELAIAGAGDPGATNTWSAIYLGDANGPVIGNASRGWTIAYKKAAGLPSQEHLEFNYYARPGGTFLRAQRGALVLAPPAGPGLNGRVGVAVGSPVTTLDVGGDATIRGALTVTTGGAIINGNVAVNGIVTATSDRRLKKDIQPLDEDVFSKLLSLQAVSYLRRDQPNDAKREIGFVAQDVEEIFPEFVQTDDAGIKSVNYSQMTAVLTEGFKRLSSENQKLQSENIEMKAQMNSLQIQLRQTQMLLERLERKVHAP